MRQKGQALVEFVLIMPIMILIFLSLIDIGNIFMQKHELNNTLETVSSLYQNDDKQLKAYIANENVLYKEEKNGDLVKITIKKDIKVNAPGLSQVLGKNYTISAFKNVYVDTNKEISDEQ